MATISYEVDGVTNVVFFDATMSEQHEGIAEVTEHEIERGSDLADHVKPLRPALSLEVFITNTPIPNRGKGPYDVVGPKEGRVIGAKVPTQLSTSQAVITDGGVNQATRPPNVKLGYVAPFLTPAGSGAIVQATQGTGPRISFPPVVTPGRFSPNAAVGVVANVYTFPNPRDRLRDLWEALNNLRVQGQVLKVFTRLQDYDNMILSRVGAPVEAMDAIRFSLSFKQVGFADSLSFLTVDKVAANAKKTITKKDLGPKKTFDMTSPQKQSLVDMGAQSIVGFRTPDEVLADHPNPKSS